MKNWLEVSIPINAEIEEAVSNYLFELGCSGCQQTEHTLIVYFSDDGAKVSLMQSIQRYLEALSHLGFVVPSADLRFRTVADQDWNAEWKRYFKPVVVSERLVIKPSWEEYVAKGNEIVIEIDPKQAFGTGTHETTQIMLNLIERHLTRTDAVLDVGTGTGILAIAAAKLGTGPVFAFDKDRVAVAAAAENVQQNSTPGIRLFAGDLNAVKMRRHFDLILANLNRNLILDVLPLMTSMLSPRGRLLLSGILTEDRPELTRMLSSLPGVAAVDEKVQGEWLGLVIERQVT